MTAGPPTPGVPPVLLMYLTSALQVTVGWWLHGAYRYLLLGGDQPLFQGKLFQQALVLLHIACQFLCKPGHAICSLCSCNSLAQGAPLAL